MREFSLVIGTKPRNSEYVLCLGRSCLILAFPYGFLYLLRNYQIRYVKEALHCPIKSGLCLLAFSVFWLPLLLSFLLGQNCVLHKRIPTMPMPQRITPAIQLTVANIAPTHP